MGERITLPVLADRVDHVAQSVAQAARTFEKRCDHDDEQRRHTHEKLGRDMNDGLVGVHKRVDAFHRCALRSIVGFAGAAISVLLSIVAYLLVEGAPWQ